MNFKSLIILSKAENFLINLFESKTISLVKNFFDSRIEIFYNNYLSLKFIL